MSVLTWPTELVNLAAWDELPVDTTHHVECSEGILYVTPKPLPRHQAAMFDLVADLRPQLPPELKATGETDILLCVQPLTVRAPDVLVTTRAAVDANPPRLAAADVLLVVEILSPGSRRMDRVMKFSEYAEAGIPEYWILDLEDSLLTSYELGADGAYKSTGDHTGPTTIQSCGTTLTIDVTSLA